MLIYTLEPRFHVRTGKPLAPELTGSSEWICDYCGTANQRDVDSVIYQCSESDLIEPQFHDMSVPGFPDVLVYELFGVNQYYQYCTNWEDHKFCETKMLIAGIKKKENFMLCHMMYDARLKMLAKLLKAKTHKIDSGYLIKE